VSRKSADTAKSQTKTLTVGVKYLVSLAEKVGCKQETVRFAEGDTLADLAAWLQNRHEIKVPDPGIIAVLNGKGWMQLPSKLETKLGNGDVVLLFPPISGG
jgi:molybdopterin converting factor small subunit